VDTLYINKTFLISLHANQQALEKHS